LRARPFSIASRYTYEFSSRDGDGNSTDWDTTSNSTSSFTLLSNLSNVEAIGLNSGVSLNDLKPYDSNQTPQTNIDPKDLANSIIGHTEATMPGHDTVSGGEGNDILIGGSGGDTFVWKAGDTGNDVIKDFKASEGDRIDLRDLLQGETGSTIDNFLKITTVDGVSSLQVSSTGQLNSGNAAAATPDVTIKLEGNNWSSANLHNLIAGSDPTIKVDHNNS
jgi:surface adhesion protein